MSRALAGIVLALAALAVVGQTRAGAPQAAELPLAGFHQAVLDPGSGRVFVTGSPTADKGPFKPQRFDSTVGVLSGSGGWERGSRELSAPAGITVKPGTRDVFVALFRDNAIVQLDGSTLKEVRRFTLPLAMQCPDWLVWAKGRVWFTVNCGDGAGIASLDPATGQIRTEADGPGSSHAVIAARGEYLVAGEAAQSPSNLVAYRIVAGRLKVMATKKRAFPFISDLAITAQGDVLVASHQYLMVFGLPRLTPRMRYGTGGGFARAVAASADGRALFGGARGDGGDVYAFRPGRPNAYWKLDFGPDPNGSVMYRGLLPSAAPGTVFSFSERYGTVHPFLHVLRYPR